MRILIYAAVLCCCLKMNAQENPNEFSNENSDNIGSVSGKVLTVLKEVLPYTTIVIKNGGDEILAGDITDEKGMFKIEKLPIGDLSLEVTYIGYKTVCKNIKIDSGDYKLDLGFLVLERDLNFLNFKKNH